MSIMPCMVMELSLKPETKVYYWETKLFVHCLLGQCRTLLWHNCHLDLAVMSSELRLLSSSFYDSTHHALIETGHQTAWIILPWWHALQVHSINLQFATSGPWTTVKGNYRGGRSPWLMGWNILRRKFWLNCGQSVVYFFFETMCCKKWLTQCQVTEKSGRTFPSQFSRFAVLRLVLLSIWFDWSPGTCCQNFYHGRFKIYNGMMSPERV